MIGQIHKSKCSQARDTFLARNLVHSAFALSRLGLVYIISSLCESFDRRLAADILLNDVD